MRENEVFDYYLSVPTEADMPEIPDGATLDVIGTWSDYDANTETSTQRDGYHFNVRSTQEVDWPENVTVAEPKTPWRVFA